MYLKDFRKLLIEIFYVSIPLALPLLVGFIFSLVVAKKFSLIDFGSLAFANIISAFIIGFSDLSLKDFLLTSKAKKIGIASFGFLLHLSILFFLIFSAITFSYLVLNFGNSIIFYIFLALGPEIFSYSVLQKTIYYQYQKRRKILIFSKIDALLKIISGIFKISLLLITKDLIFSIALGSALTFAMYLVWLKKYSEQKIILSVIKKNLMSVTHLLISKYKFWAPFTFSSLSFYFYSSVDKLIIGHSLGLTKLAIYSFASSFIAIGQIPVAAFWSIYMGNLSKLKGTNYKKILVISSVGGFAVFTLLEIFAVFFFDIIVPEKYGESKILIQILAAYFIFRFPVVSLEIFWVSIDRYKFFVNFRYVVSIFNLALNLLLIKKIGLLGAAITFVFSELLLFLILLSFNKKLLKSL